MLARHEVRDDAGRPIQLGRELGRGGEGAVYETSDSNRVAKLYIGPRALPPERVEKLRYMVTGWSHEIEEAAAWPSSLLTDRAGAVLGFLMPRVVGFHEIHSLYGPSSRKKLFPHATWAFLVHAGMNCAAAFHRIHSAGHVIGDVNAKNIFVSPQATVRLIDCDSFQVHAGARWFLSGMHVPEFTPPELQARDLQSVVRTPNHDLFGLALTLFHLLLLGRHPFIGVPLPEGTEPLPIEAAIAQFRFAFGRDAADRQMRPPPNTLPLECLPYDLVDLFRRSFLRGSEHNGRPSALEWRDALFRASSQLATCPAETTHVYPRQNAECPWCTFIRTGVADFFPDGQSLITFACPSAEIAALWATVSSNSLAPRPVPRTSVSAITVPSPLPADAIEDRVRLRHTRAVAWMTAAVGVLALLSATSVIWLMLPGIALLLGAAAAGLRAAALGRNSRYADEVSRRTGLARAAADRMWAVRQRLDSRYQAYEGVFRAHRPPLAAAHQDLSALQSMYDQELAALIQGRRDAQHRAFLDAQLIVDARIDKIGPSRKHTLISYGIETAYDVLHGSLHGVPGFGPALRAALQVWAKGVGANFRFDSTRDISEAEKRQVVLKYRQRKLALRGALENGARELRTQNEGLSRDLVELIRQLEAISLEHAQAQLDCSVL